ncbi:chromo domain-containing protein [Colletotrichum tofieldiae]|uniref:Chromo domain-containing protein n=1 Tax=Colletotrichum tofieldiae TaxID=708197 RepID=A0A161WP27_9PEZI|nr:chromo domain-containing protein [Colletotrichum tofieldiae]GKT52902.1 chromo domain-containing protein [Colletotrichum tofieldiae]GKT80702.1 chromo domain-containing protein [Colletotrichum tofieldiae]
MARLTESPAPPNGTQSVKKSQTTLMNSAHNFLSSPARPSGSQSPHPSKRVKSLAATGTPRSDASRSHSPPSQRLSPHIPVSPSPRKALSDTAGDDLDAADRSTPADAVSAAAPVEPADAATPPALATAKGATPDLERSSSTPEPNAQRPGSGVLSSVRKTFHSAVNNLTGQRTGTTTITSTFEQTIVSRKRSREPEADETPAPADKEAENNIDAANGTDGNDTTIQLGNQFEAEVAAEEIRAKSPVKEAVQVASPAADDAEINVATATDSADTVEAAAPAQDAAPEAAGDEDVEMDDPKTGVFVLDKIIGHRRDPKDKTLFQMHVSWKNDEPTWEPEQTIQEDAEEALFAYWDSVKGGRLGAMADKNLWHVLKIEKHKQKPSGAVHFLVYWIGSPDRSWEPETQVEVYARQHVEDYWRSKGGRDKNIKTAAAPAKRGRGRPRKNTLPDPVAEAEAPKDALKDAAKEAKPRGRPGRKQKRDEAEAETQTDKTAEAVTTENAAELAAKEPAEVDGEPPKKRGRGRPRKNPVS